ncbi:MAG: DUF1440 domain-containing protein [Bacteroidota bacterium]
MIQGTLTAQKPRSATKTILWAGLIAGTLDGAGAVTYYLLLGRKDPIKIFNFIASGIFGKTGLTGGLPMAFAGLLFHYIIAIIWATIFFLLYPKIHHVIKNKVVLGVLYGAFVWCGMNIIVLPLSSTPPIAFVPVNAMINMAILMAFIGIPISLIVQKHYSKE